MITPTIGRVVWFHPASNEASSLQPICAAIVARVWSDTMVNLAVFDADGKSHSCTSVPLIQDDQTPPALGYYCEWMPYQKGQAVKTEALELASAAHALKSSY